MFHTGPATALAALIQEPITEPLDDADKFIQALLCAMDPEARINLIGNHVADPDRQIWLLRLVHHGTAQPAARPIVASINKGYTVLDSGASVHVAPKISNADRDATMPLSGFSGETTWTTGTGDIHRRWINNHTNERVDFTLTQVNECGNVAHTIASMGNLKNVERKWLQSQLKP